MAIIDKLPCTQAPLKVELGPGTINPPILAKSAVKRVHAYICTRTATCICPAFEWYLE